MATSKEGTILEGANATLDSSQKHDQKDDSSDDMLEMSLVDFCTQLDDYTPTVSPYII